MESYTDELAVMVLIGNKNDSLNKAVTDQEIRNFVQTKKLHYFETSAKNAVNVN